MSSIPIKHKTDLHERLRKDPNGDRLFDCLTCGICISRCSWYDAEGGPNPRRMARLALLGLDDELAKDPMIWNCMICNRCTIECPMGIDMDKVVRRARSLPAAEAIIPADFKKGVPLRLETGNVNGVSKEDYVDTLEWLSEELAMEVDDESAEMPIDKADAKYMYIPNPREINLIPMYLVAVAKLMHKFGENWTFSSDCSDVTNWGYYIGDDDAAAKMVLQVVEAAEKLNIDTLVLSECGHGYKVLKHMVEQYIGRKPNFKVVNMPELTLEKLEAGVIRLDKSATAGPVAYHDPCNIGRKSGLYDVPRKLLAACCEEVVELTPNRKHAICCGGGGGILQDSDSFDRRMLSGKAKANQMRAVGTPIIATSCLSCHRQLGELCKHYEIKAEIKTVISLTAKALA